jgi:hypothetical protein
MKMAFKMVIYTLMSTLAVSCFSVFATKKTKNMEKITFIPAEFANITLDY